METVPLPPRAKGLPVHSLRRLSNGWHLECSVTGTIRPLNYSERRMVDATIAACAAHEAKATAQLRRDLTNARAATEALAAEWRASLGMGDHGADLGAATRTRVAMHRGLLERVDRLIVYARWHGHVDQAHYSPLYYGRAVASAHAAETMTGKAFEVPERPTVWAQDATGIRGAYRMHRAAGNSILTSALLALFSES